MSNAHRRHHTTRRRIVLNPCIKLPAHTFDDGARAKAVGAIPHAFTAFTMVGFDQHMHTHYHQPVCRKMIGETNGELVCCCYDCIT